MITGDNPLTAAAIAAEAEWTIFWQSHTGSETQINREYQSGGGWWP